MAKIEFGEDLSSNKANSVYLLKSEDDTIVAILSLENGLDVNKYVANLQEYLYEISDTSGMVGEGDPNRKNYSSINYIANGDSRKLAIEKLDAQVKVNADNIANNVLAIGVNADDIQAIIDSKGQANGICPLNANAKIDPVYLSDVLLIYQGTWDASTNTPTLANTDTGVENFWYRCNVAGSVDFGAGAISFNVGDKVVNNGTIWEKWDTTDEVISVAGKTGAVVLDNTDVGLGNVTNDAQLKRSGNDWILFTEKTNPVDDDIVIIEDSEDTGAKKVVKLTNLLGGGGGGGSFAWGLNEDISPIESIEGGIETLDFDFESEMAISALVAVPVSYKAGDPITLEDALFFSAGTSDNVLFKALTTLFKVGDDITSPTNTHTSTNTEKTLTTANELTAIGSMDLTDGTGNINGVAVAPGDILKVKLYRDNTNETTSSSEDARFLRYSSSVRFKPE